MKIEEGLSAKNKELDELQQDINTLEDQAAVLKDSVKKYNELKSKSAELKKTKKQKQREYDTVINFFQNVDSSYLDKIFPLFANQTEKEAVTA